MSGYNNWWMSPLQMGRRIRNLHFWYHNGVSSLRYYAIDAFSQHTHPWIVDSDETWDFDIQMYRDLVVDSGATLTLKCKVAMAADGKITVKKGGKLVLDGAIVTGWCKKGPAGSSSNASMWRGIELEGHPNSNQAINQQTGRCPTQGLIEILPNSMISKAKMGVLASVTDAAGVIQSNTSGGIVKAYGGLFLDNQRDLVMFKKVAESSTIDNCIFKTAGEIGRTYGNSLIAPMEHIKLFENTGIKIRNCTFECATNAPYVNFFPNKGTGIYTTDGNYLVDSCEFKNLYVGHFADNFNPVYAFEVKNSVFTDNQTGIIIHNVNYATVRSNTITLPAQNNQALKGIYMCKARYYNIRNNFITQSTYYTGTGIAAYNSQGGVHQIYRNNISRMLIGINAVDENGAGGTGGFGLLMNCNVFNDGQANQMDIACTKTNAAMPIVMEEQSKQNPGPATQMVRNLYGAGIYASWVKNKWWVDPSSTQTIIHSNTPTGADNPEYINDQAADPVNVYTTSTSFTWSLDCEPNPQATGGNGNATSRIANLNDHIGGLWDDMDPGEHHNDAEIQASVSSKLGIFLGHAEPDEVTAYQDSAEAILGANQGLMEDADIQLIFVYLRGGKFTEAGDLIGNLPTERAAWKSLLEKMLVLYQDDEGIMSLKTTNSQYETYFRDLALDFGADGEPTAEAIAYQLFGDTFEMPLPVPPDDSGERIRMSLDEQAATGLLIYPNPAQTGFWIEKTEKASSVNTVRVLDATGREVSVKMISGEREFIALPSSRGVYFIVCCSEDGTIVHKKKIIRD